MFIFSQGLADNTVIAKVNGELWDLDRPFEGDASLQLLKFDDKDGILECFGCYLLELEMKIKCLSKIKHVKVSLICFDFDQLRVTYLKL